MEPATKPRRSIPRSRFMGAVLRRALSSFPVVVVTGARQTGKSTLIRELLEGPERVYRTLDDLDALDAARSHPDTLLGLREPVTVDEVQRSPELLLAIKREVDRERRPGRFLLSGSANLLLMERVAESLAGRAAYLFLHPLTVAERRGLGKPADFQRLYDLPGARDLRAFETAGKRKIDWASEILRGGFPPASLHLDDEARPDWFRGYELTYLERDLRQISEIENLPDFRRLLQLSVHRIGSVLNQADLGRDAGLPQQRAHRYLNLLETSFLIHRVAAYSVNRTKRLVKSPRLYFCDTGLAAFEGGITTALDLEASPLKGALLENLVLGELLAWRETRPFRPEILYWRTVSGAEVDFVIEERGRLLPIEVKAGTRVGLSDAKHLETFLDEYPDRATHGIVLYTGTRAEPLTKRVTALPLAAVLGIG